MIGSRPGIGYAVSYLGCSSNTPGEAHLTAARGVLGYLQYTGNYGILYNAIFVADLMANLAARGGYSDSDWAGDRDLRKSTSGYAFMLGSGAVSWKSSRQRAVTCASTENAMLSMKLAKKEFGRLGWFGSWVQLLVLYRNGAKVPLVHQGMVGQGHA